ncbi:MAG: aspartate kinase, partial [Bacteroidota bacterium]
MRVFKFGGASVKDAESIRNTADIIDSQGNGPLVVVVSAMGKTTNALEAVCDAYFQKDGTANEKLDAIKVAHYEVAQALFDTQNEVFAAINDTFVEIDWILEDDPEESYDYLYDQIVSIGEFLSTKIIAAYLNSRGMATRWLDVRDVILTDNTYREARVDWKTTEQNMKTQIPSLLENGIVLTQGFIGGTSENFTTTLGREGSDFTAAIFSTCLNANSMTVWKDVPGILSADPKLFKNVTKIDRLSFQEAIEMTYYG